jgi:hypothetical protein
MSLKPPAASTKENSAALPPRTLTGVTDTAPWTPLSRRAAGLSPDSLVEGIPDWLYPRLQEWLYHVLQFTDGPVTVLRPGHGLTATTREIMVRIRTEQQPWLLAANDPKFLDALDATVAWGDWVLEGWTNYGSPDTLERLLAAANSAWRVNADWRGLERRINATVTAAVADTISNAGAEAASHLAAAWDAAYGRHPDPDKAYAEAIKAVEAVACPIALPNSATATLGTVRNHLRDAATKWELVLPGSDGTPGNVAPMTAMLTALWEGQRSRHAGTPTSRRQSHPEAAAVHLAATLVQWVTTGVLHRKAPTHGG